MSAASGVPSLPGLSGGSAGASDASSIQALRSAAARDPKAAIRETAKQCETLFMQQLMKSMREATISSGMLENSGTQLGNEMLDVQYARKMSGLPGGLADAIARQLERQMVGGTAPVAASPAAGAAASSTGAALSPKQIDFIAAHQAAAKSAEATTGIPAAFMIAQAAHESGWGRREIRNSDGSSAHNLFGIKAGAGWNGPVTEITTTEYVAGAAQKVSAKFRAYASAEESFRDYARLMKESPRYSGVVAQAAQAPAGAASAQGFADGLQRAGYATDPGYAAKLARVINTTLRLQRAT